MNVDHIIMSIQNNLSKHNHQQTNGGKNHQEPITTTTAAALSSNDVDKSQLSMKNGHPTTMVMANHQPNVDFRMLPIIEQCSNNHGGKPRSSIHSMTNSQKSNLVNRTKKFLKGICLTILSGLFFSITTLVVKYVKDVSPGTTAGFRYFGKFDRPL